MYHLATKSVDLKVTPEHHLFIKPHHSCWQFSLPERVQKLRSFKIKIGCKWLGKTFFFENLTTHLNHKTKKLTYHFPLHFNIQKLMWLLGFWTAEGCLRDGTVIRLSQMPNSLAFKKAVSIIKDLKLHPNISGKEIYFSCKELAQYLSKWGSKSSEKRVPIEIKNMESVDLITFLEGYFAGDGWKTGGTHKTWCASTTSKFLADDLQEIGLKAGFAPKIHENPEKISLFKRRMIHTQKTYTLTFSSHLCPEIQKRKNPLEVWENYEGEVYSCTVPSGIILVRRNGKPIWSGNSDKFARLCQFAKTEELKVKDESVIDTLQDLAVYSLLCIMLFEEKNE